MEQENSWVLFIGSPWLLCVQDPIFHFPSALALAILSSSHLVLSAVLAFAKRLRNFGWQHRSQKETEEIANQNKTSIMQLPGDAGSLCSALSLCRDVTSLERTQRRIIQTPSLETPETEIIFYLCKWKFLTGIETYPRPLGMYELAQAQARMYYHVWYEYLKCWSEKFEWRLLLVCWLVRDAEGWSRDWGSILFTIPDTMSIVFLNSSSVHLSRVSFNAWPCVFWASLQRAGFSQSIRRR